MFTTDSKQNNPNFFNHDYTQKKALYKLANIQVKFGKREALRDVNLQINEGEIVFLTGVSGAGKTTLLNVLAGNIRPSSGTIAMSESKFSAQVFQDLRLIERMTCYENLMLSYDPSLYKNKNEFLNDLNELAKILGVKSHLNLKIHEANGGLKQKIAIIRALLTRPEVFIADEPTSSLDFDNAKRLFDLLNIYNSKRGMTIIWASHNRELVQRFVGKILHLDNGRLIHSGHACFI